MELLSDAFTAFKLVSKKKAERTLQAWIYTPIGVVITLGIICGIQTLIGLSSVQFPASVACMILLFLALLAWENLFGTRSAKQIFVIVELPAGFGLRYLNIFFTPSFILLPLSTPVRGMEVAKIIGVFVVGFITVLPTIALLTRQLHLLLGTSKRYPYARCDQPDQSAARFDPSARSQKELPLTELPSGTAASSSTMVAPALRESNKSDETLPPSRSSSEYSNTTKESIHQILPLIPTADVARVRGPGPDIDLQSIKSTSRPPTSPQQQPHIKPLSRAEMWAARLCMHVDTATYTIFLAIGIPIYLAGGPAFLMHLSITVLAYFAAISFPPNVRKYIHPVIATSAMTVLCIYIMSLVKCSIHGLPVGTALERGLHDEFKTGEKYLQLLAPNKTPRKWPGAGDIFGSLLDVGIVGLALPMWTYRRELKQHYVSILVPNLIFSVGSLFAYPALCSSIGIAIPRSLAFAARSVTLALATPAVANLKGDQQFVAVIGIMTGIMGVLIGGWILEVIRIPLDDYVSRGVSLGSVSSAITTAQLLTVDPRAAALSSLSMAVFGICMVALTAIPPVVQLVWGVVGR